MQPFMENGTNYIAPRVPWTLVGAGSLGSKSGLHLAHAGNGPSAVVDRAKMAPHNAARQALIPPAGDLQVLWSYGKASLLSEALRGLNQTATDRGGRGADLGGGCAAGMVPKVLGGGEHDGVSSGSRGFGDERRHTCPGRRDIAVRRRPGRGDHGRRAGPEPGHLGFDGRALRDPGREPRSGIRCVQSR